LEMFEKKGEDVYIGFGELERLFERMVGDLFGGRGHPLLGPAGGELEPTRWKRDLERRPFTDIQETEKEVIITSELPGMERDEIEIEVSGDRVEITADRKYEEEKEEEGYVRRERDYRSFRSSFELPAEVDAGKAKATYKNGVLEIALPKTKAGKKTRVKVE